MSAVGRFLRRFAIALLFVLAAASGTVAGVLVVYTSDLPQISALDDYAPSTITRVYAAGGEVVGEFATQRRIVITYDQIPPVHAAGDHGGRGRRVRLAHGPQHHAHHRDAGPAISSRTSAPAPARSPSS